MTAIRPEAVIEPDVVASGICDSARTIRIGLAGCGVVGGALVRLLHESSATLTARHGVHLEISRVLVRDVYRYRAVPLSSDVFTNDAALFNAENVDVVVEAIGGDDTAFEIAHSALKRGRRFVTANKQLVASRGPELTALAQLNGASLDLGAAVGGSAPVTSLIKEVLGTVTPNSVRGILNGTTNYILTLVESGMSFGDAVKGARREGLAEADLSRDLTGLDAAAKLSIICWLSYGIPPREVEVNRIALTPRADRLIHHAAKLGGKVRVLSECVSFRDCRVAATVEPVVVSPASNFALTCYEENRVEIDLGWNTPLAISGLGAGGHPTAAALLSDLLRTPSHASHHQRHDTPFVSTDDPREHQWLIVSECQPETVASEIEVAGYSVSEITSSGRDAAFVVQAQRSALDEVLVPIRRRGVEPLVARIEPNWFRQAHREDWYA